MRITVAILSILAGSSSAFAPSSTSQGVTSTRLNLNDDKDGLLSDPNADDRRTFVAKVSVILRVNGNL